VLPGIRRNHFFWDWYSFDDGNTRVNNGIMFLFKGISSISSTLYSDVMTYHVGHGLKKKKKKRVIDQCF
jgi:hypothetical protein